MQIDELDCAVRYSWVKQTVDIPLSRGPDGCRVMTNSYVCSDSDPPTQPQVCMPKEPCKFVQVPYDTEKRPDRAGAETPMLLRATEAAPWPGCGERDVLREPPSVAVFVWAHPPDELRRRGGSRRAGEK